MSHQESSRKSKSRAKDSKKSQCDSQMDSGFMSGSNLLSSTSLCSEGSLSYDKDLSDDHRTHSTQDSSYGKSGVIATTSDFLDSGIDLNLSVGMSSLDLTADPTRETEVQSHFPPSIKDQETQPSAGNCHRGQEGKSRLEQMGLSPVHITILKEIYKKDDDGDTQLHVAVMRGFFEVVWHITRLLPHQALLDVPNNSGRTALHLAVSGRDSNLARHLIVCGASPVSRNQKGDTPLHVACRNGDWAMVNDLTSQVTSDEVVNARLCYPPNHTQGLLAADLNNYDGQTCVHIAAQGGHKEILQHLTWYGADINAKECKCGRTALHFAVESLNSDLVRFLSETCRAALSIQTYAGLTPYQLSVANDAPLLATLLEELGAKKETLPSTCYAEDDLEYEDDSVPYGSEDTPWGPVHDDIQIGGFPYAGATAVPVSTHGTFNADHFL